MKYVLALALVAVLLFAAVFAQEAVDQTELAHILQKKESHCTDRCVTLTSIASEKCLDICTNIATSKQSVESALKRFKTAVKGGKKKATKALSDEFNGEAAEQQKEATKHLWELFHTNMKQILANSGTPDAGFQMLPNAIEGSSIRQVAGDEMPAAALSSLSLEDFDNPEFLGREMIQVSSPGPHRNTRGIRWIDEYKAFLAGVAGISQIPQIPDPDQTESAQKAVQYMDELAKCQDNYFTSRFSQMYNMEQFQNMFCAKVSFLQREMFAALGREQARIGNNPAYAASVALGMAQGLYTDSTAFKKSISVRMMEWDCLRSQVDPSIPYRASPRSFAFAYNHHSYKRTQKSSSFNVSVGIPVINTTIGVNSQKGKETSADLTAIGGVSISFADVKYIPLYAGNWFSPTAMRDFRWFRREASASPISRFFNAEGGTMNLFPRALIIAVNPTIGLNVETSAKESFIKTSQLAVTAGGNIFGLELNAGFNKQARVEEGKENGGNTQINIKSESCVPQLFAVDNYYYY